MPLTEPEKKILHHIDTKKDEIARFLRDLVRARSDNPPGDTRRAAQILMERFASFGASCEVHALEEDKPNLVMRLGEGMGRELLFNSHLDTVGSGDRAQWRYDPFGGEVVGDRLYGRGAGDAKSSLVAMTMAAQCLVEVGVTLKGTCTINPVSDEENGGHKGAEWLVTQGLLKPTWVVVGEQTLNEVAIAEKGLLWFRLKTSGRSAHASTPWEGINAISQMVFVLSEIERVIGGKIRNQSHPLTSPPSLNLGTIQGGIRTNVVADSCEATIDRRMTPDESLEKTKEEFLAVIEECRHRDPELRIEVSLLGAGEPFSTSPQEEIVQQTLGVRRDLGLSARCVGYRQVSDGRFFAQAGIPTIILGPSDPALGHAPNEFVELDQVIEATKIYALLAMRLLK